MSSPPSTIVAGWSKIESRKKRKPIPASELRGVQGGSQHNGNFGACVRLAAVAGAHTRDAASRDCAKQFKEVKSRASGEETEKSITEMLIEELKQREEEATEAQQQADVKLLEAKKLASQYQKEADKCSSGMDTCEEAREKSAESLLGQRKLTALWEERARELGWKPGNDKPHQNQ
ncbi:hypothetical protein TRIUR3_33709 [Triticum urartu]|uniref:Uncharacterized protein n=1 Tax=Triticum urartu TaxID=4572 RepID=M7YZ76_TRIUA|nr:hypothetical protein TRIUR3_33709 [Triticum urartu]